MYNISMSEGIYIQDDKEIKKALEEFELKSDAEEARKKNQDLKSPKASRMTGFVIKYSRGRVKDQIQAEYILFAFVITAFAMSLFLIFGVDDESTQFEIPSGTRIIYPPNAPPRLERY